MKTSDIQVTPIHPERWGDDLDVVNAARVSFNKESSLEVKPEFKKYGFPHELADSCFQLAEKDKKLIHYLAKHQHFSPFNHSFLSFRIKAPIFVARQLVKHKFMPWNEVSRRYVDEEPEFYFPKYWRAKADNVKQGSSEIPVDDLSYESTEMPVEVALEAYNALLKQGVCAEQARMILPQNMMTEWWWSGTLGAFCDMLVLRLNPHAQYESRVVARKIRDLIEPVFPVSLKARLEAAGVE